MSLDPAALDGRSMEVTQATIDAWAELGGDHNRLHVDPEYAKTGPYGRTIAHGPIAASFVCEVVAQAVAAAWPVRLAVELRFNNPVFVPTALVLRAEATEGGNVRVHCSDHEGRAVMSAVVEVDEA